MYRMIPTLFVAAGALAACDFGTDVDGGATVDIALATTPSSSATDGAAAAAALGPQPPARSIAVAGTNGTLTIDEIHVIVAEFELEGALSACDVEFDDDDCEEFEAPAALVRIPTDGTALQVATSTVPLGTYSELEWEVEDLDFDDDDDADDEEAEAVRSQIEAIFGAGVWPAEASMAITGSFLPEAAPTALDFTTFFAAEIEVEIDLSPPLELTEEGESRQITILLSPDVWFRNVDGTVLNLAALSGQLVEFEAEFEDGVVEIEIERDDD